MSEANLSDSTSTNKGGANCHKIISVFNKPSAVIWYVSAVGFKLNEFQMIYLL